MIREKLTRWLGRPSPDRSVQAPGDIPVVISSDVGSLREQNQDRVAVMRVSPGGNTKPFIAIALADGMGGMRDGAACAAMTISSFFFGLIKFRGLPPERRMERAAQIANEDVFAFSNAEGGATLSAVLFRPSDEPILINVGDSRIYAACGAEKENEIRRLTVDDSIEEALGGHGRDLLQFIGMGPSLKPHVLGIPHDSRRLIITSDGVHFINKETMSDIILNSADNKQVAERLGALVRWSGAPDNASLVMATISSTFDALLRNEDVGIEVWDHFGSLNLMWLKNDAGIGLPLEGGADFQAEPMDEQQRNSAPESQQDKGGGTKERKPKKPRTRKKGDTGLEPQLEIEMSEGSKEGGER